VVRIKLKLISHTEERGLNVDGVNEKFNKPSSRPKSLPPLTSPALLTSPVWKAFPHGIRLVQPWGWNGGWGVGFVFSFDAKNKIILVAVQGHISDAVLSDGYASMGKYAASHGPCRAIVDASGVTKFEVSSHTVRGLARSAPAIPVGYARVIVAPQAHLYGMMRMFQMLGELTRPDLQVVRTMEEAYQLLRVESPEFTPLPIPEEGS